MCPVQENRPWPGLPVHRRLSCSEGLASAPDGRWHGVSGSSHAGRIVAFRSGRAFPASVWIALGHADQGCAVRDRRQGWHATKVQNGGWREKARPRVTRYVLGCKTCRDSGPDRHQTKTPLLGTCGLPESYHTFIRNLTFVIASVEPPCTISKLPSGAWCSRSFCWFFKVPSFGRPSVTSCGCGERVAALRRLVRPRWLRCHVFNRTVALAGTADPT